MKQTNPTFGQQIAKAARAIEKQRTSYGRKWVVVFLNEDTITIAMHGSLSTMEKSLAKSPIGLVEVRKVQQQLFSRGTVGLFRKIKKITAMDVLNTTVEINPSSGSVVLLLKTNTIGSEFPQDPLKFKNPRATTLSHRT